MSVFNDYTANLEYKLELLQKGIRKIRDQFGDDKCWMDWHALFAMLPEGYTPPTQDISIQLEDCKRYLKCKANNTEYMPPARWVVGPPDKFGLWFIHFNDQNRVIFDYKQTSKLFEGWDLIIQSFGPIPQPPIGDTFCLLKNAS